MVPEVELRPNSIEPPVDVFTSTLHIDTNEGLTKKLLLLHLLLGQEHASFIHTTKDQITHDDQEVESGKTAPKLTRRALCRYHTLWFEVQGNLMSNSDSLW